MLEGKNIILRLLTEDDLEELLTRANDYSQKGEFISTKFLVPAVFRKEFNEHGWWQDNKGMMLITDKNGRMLGSIVFFEAFMHEAGYEIGYGILRQDDRGQGYITEALRIFSAYLFELKPIARLHAKMVKGNVASQRVLEKCGYRLEGTFKRFGFVRGEYRDHEVYALLREDCPSLDETLQV
ncbi:MAG: GNAT family N-acetyltransferase [Phycisphaerales bacterium]|nr:MAG: GNAT family N-acetyltransferase [Phycisphaerales bacterium]